MRRREFLLTVLGGVAAGWLGPPWPALAGPMPTPPAAAPGLRLALLADAHLEGGNPSHPRARALAQCVTHINSLNPAPDLAVFLGDLAHAGDADALALGRELLHELCVPLRLLRGEHDGHGPWRSLFGEAHFAESHRGVHLLGVDTALPRAGAPAFRVGPGQRRRLRQELSGLDPDTPVVILSHAPLYQMYRPWRFWTADAGEVQALLAPFTRVVLLHGHVHRDLRLCHARLVFQGLPATSWALPDVRQGTPGGPLPCPTRAAGGPGCGWSVLTIPDTTQDLWVRSYGLDAFPGATL